MNRSDSCSKWSLLLALAAAWCLAGCGSDASRGYGARCTDAADCGGETPLCSGGSCVECAAEADCDGRDPLCTNDGFCAECNGDGDCPAGAPFCDDRGRCRECGNDGHCGAGQPVCIRGECEPSCTADSMCDQDQLCHPSLGACVECAEDNDCYGNEDGALCDPDRLRCVDCLSGGDCGVARPFCIGGDCRECIQNTDCGAAQICNGDLECRSSCSSDADCDDGDRGHCIVQTGICVECELDTNCTYDADQPVCIGGRCEECRGNDDCPADNPTCDLENNECGGG